MTTPPPPTAITDERLADIETFLKHYAGLSTKPTFLVADDIPALITRLRASEARLREVEKERDAYKRAKAENDERYMIERDTAEAAAERWKGLYDVAWKECRAGRFVVSTRMKTGPGSEAFAIMGRQDAEHAHDLARQAAGIDPPTP